MPSVEKFRASLKHFRIPEEIIGRIDEGFEKLNDRSPKPQRAAYFTHAVTTMDETLDFAVQRDVMDWNGCCKSGARDKASRAFAAKYAALPLVQRLEKIGEVPYMGTAALDDDGTLVVHAVSFAGENGFRCACPTYHQTTLDTPLPAHYCLCCAGHFRYHYQLMLGVSLQTLEVVSSPLASMGREPCVLRFGITG